MAIGNSKHGPQDPEITEGEDGGTRPHRWMLILPFLWQVAAIPWANGVAFAPFGIPFPMAWQMAGVVFATIVIAIVYRIDNRAEHRA